MSAEENSDANDLSQQLIAELASADDRAFGNRVCAKAPNESLEDFCSYLRDSLATHRLVFHPFSEESPVQDDLLLEDSVASAILGEDFHRVIVLDVAACVTDGFELAEFYRYVFEQFTSAFEIGISESYHEEDMVQILRDEPKSLICLLNVQLVPSITRKRLRCLTQEGHQSLIIYSIDEATQAKHVQGFYVLELHFMVDGNPSAKIHQLLKQTTIGRKPTCEISIADPSVSRQHMRVSIENGQYFAEDLKSQNGTFVNGKKIENRVRLNAGDQLMIGSTILFSRSTKTFVSPLVEGMRRIELEDDFDEAGTIAEFDTGQIALQEAIQKLDQDSQTILKMRIFEDRKLSQIADQLSMTIIQVRDKYLSALQQLEELMRK